MDVVTHPLVRAGGPVPAAGPLLTCVRTGSPRSVGACLAARDGSCAYCGLPPVDVAEQAKLTALLDEREQLAAEVWR